MGSKEVIENMNMICDGRHDHDHTQSSAKNAQNDGGHKTVNASAWAGMSSKEFATALLEGAENYLIQHCRSAAISQRT